MVIKYICSDKTLKPGQERDKPGRCFKKGLAAGFYAGLKKTEKTNRVRGIQPQIPKISILNNPVRLRPIVRTSTTPPSQRRQTPRRQTPILRRFTPTPVRRLSFVSPAQPNFTPSPVRREMPSLMALEKEMGQKREYRSGNKILGKAIVVDIFKKVYPNAPGKNTLRSARHPIGDLRAKLIADGHFRK